MSEKRVLLTCPFCKSSKVFANKLAQSFSCKACGKKFNKPLVKMIED